MRPISRLLAGTALSLALMPAGLSEAQAAPKVVASIKPVHSLVAAVMDGVGTPDLIVQGAGSPHGYALKPSQAAALEDADLIFWVGPELETFLEKPIETIGGSARAVELMDADGLTVLAIREGGAFEAHQHDEDGHDDHGHADDAHDDHGHDDAHDNDKDQAHADEHGHEGVDAHVWLDPENARAFVRAISEALSESDPDNAAAYAANAARVDEKLDALIAETNAALAPVRDRPFIVFHDAFHYFENRFGVEAAGSLTVNPEVKPSAERLEEIQTKVKSLSAVCAFSEPQFDTRLIDVAIEGSEARTAVLDPLGATLEDGPDLYFELIRGLTTSMTGCLTASN